MRLTSPGFLLILATASAGGIFLLGLFYFSPSVEEHRWAALREQALRGEQIARLAQSGEEKSLSLSCQAWSRLPEVKASFAPDASASEFDLLARQEFSPLGVEAACLCDGNGQILRQWSALPSLRTPSSSEGPVATAVKETIHLTGGDRGGLIDLPGGLAMFACQRVWQGPGGDKALGYLWVAKSLATVLREKVQWAVGGPVVFVDADAMPAIDFNTPTNAMWLANENTLSVVWQGRDATGRKLGYFRADLPVSTIQRQADSTRRIILIVMSLSVGLALLVILGNHMLITGPVMRLLNRLQLIEAGEILATELTRDLHGEPLVLARRLESTFDKMAQISRTDQLTGLANRKHFEEVLAAFYVQARRYNRPLSMMAMDIDFFKAVNDTAGHRTGDAVLKVLAGCIEKACRKADLPARLGGDEFALLMPETTGDDAGRLAERIRKEISVNSFSANNLQLSITLSIGVCDLNSGEIASADEMLALADRAVYAAKEKGRDSVVRARDLLSPQGREDEAQNGKISVLCKKLAGLDSRFKGLFILALEEIMTVLSERDPYMTDHARKVQRYSALIANEMGLPDRLVKRLEISAILHDIGMIGLPDSVLLCPGQLSEQQLGVMRRHPLLSVQFMEAMEFLEQEIPAVRYHHERFDGKGYPEGLAGGAIPLTARIITVADTFDAMTSPRTFRAAKTVSGALSELRQGAGTQFDPMVVEAFLAVADRLGDQLTLLQGLEVAASSARPPGAPAGPQGLAGAAVVSTIS